MSAVALSGTAIIEIDGEGALSIWPTVAPDLVVYPDVPCIETSPMVIPTQEEQL